ncbi:MAG: Dabb family protein [Actinomycetota bacterium]|jgi:hypothetical protein|nr:Dabb family protein [Actinomycetota bacterium]MDA3016278.1 Dabb family protein [Actinomycetota bacterium]MDA3028559.1 Dabb family protein [Actinomycetota bacterium]
MIRHVVMFRFHDHVTAEQIAEFGRGLSEMVPQVPGILAYAHGPDIGVNDGNYDYAVTADFASTDDYRIYRDHPVHRAVIERFTGPLVAARSGVQFMFGA